MEIKQRTMKNQCEKIQVEENNYFDNEKQSKIVSIVFKSLIMDLLAFTMILPLLPALLDHYKEIDNDKGLYSWILNQVRSIQVYLDAPDRFSSVLFGGKTQFNNKTKKNFLTILIKLK